MAYKSLIISSRAADSRTVSRSSNVSRAMHPKFLIRVQTVVKMGRSGPRRRDAHSRFFNVAIPPPNDASSTLRMWYGNRNCHSIRLRLSLCCPDPRWGISSRLFLERATDLYYFFIQILYRLFESYFYHVAAHKLVNLGYLQKWRQVMLNGVDEMKWKCSDLKCVRKPTKSRLSLTHHAMQTNPAVESRVKSLDGPRVRGIGPVGKV